MITEAEKYTKAWDMPEYRGYSPGEQAIGDFLRLVKPQKGAKILDVGCGPGRATEWLRNFGFKATGIDIAPNCLDKDVDVPLKILDFTHKKLPNTDYIFCCDVLEHIPTDRVDFALSNILFACERAFLVISYLDDNFGDVIGHPLHLTVRSHAWWKQKIEKLGFKVVRDFDHGERGIIIAGAAKGQINNLGRNIVKQTLKNLSLGLPEVTKHSKQKKVVAIVGGGPSIQDHIEEIRKFSEKGNNIVAVNGSHDYLISQGITPSAMVMIDTRAMNAKFVRNPQKDCTYLISSGCHPSVFKALEGYNVLLWHAGNRWVTDALASLGYKRQLALIDGFHSDIGAMIHDENPLKLVIGGGSTVVMRAINVLYVLGYRNMRVYGMDCCYLRGKHHAYRQDENYSLEIGSMRVAGKDFLLEGWMREQANEFIRSVHETWPDDLRLDVRGEGLIAHYMKSLV